jgi:hypothetical protein
MESKRLLPLLVEGVHESDGSNKIKIKFVFPIVPDKLDAFDNDPKRLWDTTLGDEITLKRSGGCPSQSRYIKASNGQRHWCRVNDFTAKHDGEFVFPDRFTRVATGMAQRFPVVQIDPLPVQSFVKLGAVQSRSRVIQCRLGALLGFGNLFRELRGAGFTLFLDRIQSSMRSPSVISGEHDIDASQDRYENLKVRHRMYLGFLLLALGFFLAVASAALLESKHIWGAVMFGALGFGAAFSGMALLLSIRHLVVVNVVVDIAAHESFRWRRIPGAEVSPVVALEDVRIRDDSEYIDSAFASKKIIIYGFRHCLERRKEMIGGSGEQYSFGSLFFVRMERREVKPHISNSEFLSGEPNDVHSRSLSAVSEIDSYLDVLVGLNWGIENYDRRRSNPGALVRLELFNRGIQGILGLNPASLCFVGGVLGGIGGVNVGAHHPVGKSSIQSQDYDANYFNPKFNCLASILLFFIGTFLIGFGWWDHYGDRPVWKGIALTCIGFVVNVFAVVVLTSYCC